MNSSAFDLSLIPDIAWFDAVFVILFIAFFVYVTRWMTGDKKENQKFMQDMNKEWQRTITERDKDWQKWLDNQNEKSTDCMNNVTTILKGVSDNQVRMMVLLESHDKSLEPRVEKLIDDAKNGKIPKRKPKEQV
jgi:hypothetical protein